MKSLYLRIYLTIVVVLLLFAAVSGWMFQRHIEQERVRVEGAVGDRMAAWADLLQRSLPGADAPPDEQAMALRDWSQRLRLPLALDDEQGRRIGTSDSFLRRQAERPVRPVISLRLDDGRTLLLQRPGPPPGARPGGPGGGLTPLPFLPPDWPPGLAVVVLFAALFVAVSAGAYPVVRRLTRRLESLKAGVERFGAGELAHRVEVTGRDEVAAVAASFNQAATQVEALLRSHQSLLANASHELRSPLARMKMAVAMLDDAPPAARERLKREIDTNVAELDALVEEVLLASRLDAAQALDSREPVELLGLAAEEASRVDAEVEGEALTVTADEKLVRRALRNLLENARRYGGGEIRVQLDRGRTGAVLARWCRRDDRAAESRHRDRLLFLRGLLGRCLRYRRFGRWCLGCGFGRRLRRWLGGRFCCRLCGRLRSRRFRCGLRRWGCSFRRWRSRLSGRFGRSLLRYLLSGLRCGRWLFSRLRSRLGRWLRGRLLGGDFDHLWGRWLCRRLHDQWRTLVRRTLRLEAHSGSRFEGGFGRGRRGRHCLGHLTQGNRLRRRRLGLGLGQRAVLGDVGRFGLRDQHIPFVLSHLTAAHHIVHEVTRAFDGKRTEASRRADDFAHRAGHLAAGFEADLVRAGRHFGGRVTGVCCSMARATSRRWAGCRRVTFERDLFVSL